MEKSCFPAALGRRLRHLRRLAGLTQVALAEASGVSLEHLNKIERGAAAPSLAVVESLCRALAVEPAVLFLFTPGPRDDPDAPGTDWAAAHTRLGFFTWRPDTNLILAAPSLRRLLGFAGKARQEPLADFLAAVFPRAVGPLTDALAALAAPGDRQALGVPFCRRDGEVRHGSVILEMSRQKDDQGLLALCALTDVSEPYRLERVMRGEAALIARRVRERTARQERALERLRREQADLAARERRYRDVFLHAPVGIALTTPDGRCLEANPALAGLYGQASASSLCREVTDAGRQMFADPERALELEQLLAATGRVSNFEANIRRRDGALLATRRDVRAVTDADGAVLYRESFIQDATTPDSAEQYLRRYTRIIAASSDMVSLLDAAGNYLFVNDAYIAAFGQPREAILGRHASQFLGRDYYDREVAPRLARCVAGQNVFFDRWVELPGVGRRFLSIHYSPWVDTADGEGNVMASIRDMTETRLAVEELRESEKTTSILYRVSSAVASEERTWKACSPPSTTSWARPSTPGNSTSPWPTRSTTGSCSCCFPATPSRSRPRSPVFPPASPP